MTLSSALVPLVLAFPDLLTVAVLLAELHGMGTACVGPPLSERCGSRYSAGCECVVPDFLLCPRGGSPGCLIGPGGKKAVVAGSACTRCGKA